MAKKKVTMIDPPSGWQFGFPRPLPWYHNKMDFDLAAWFLSCGYPPERLNEAMKYSRYWETEIDVSSEED